MTRKSARFTFHCESLGVDVTVAQSGEDVDPGEVREDFQRLLTIALEQSDYTRVLGESHVAQRVQAVTETDSEGDDGTLPVSDDTLDKARDLAEEKQPGDDTSSSDPFRACYENRFAGEE